MAKQLQLRRGTTSQHSTFTGANGEVTIDTDKKVVVVHDGATAGGIPLAKQATVDAKVSLVASTDKAITRFNGTSGQIQNSGVIIDDSNNIGIGVTPITWNAYKGIQIGSYADSILGFQAGGGSINIIHNATSTDNDATWQRATANACTRYKCDGLGNHTWSTAPSGTAGGTITWTNGMTLASSGNLLVGTATDNGVDKLQVNGNVLSKRRNNIPVGDTVDLRYIASNASTQLGTIGLGNSSAVIVEIQSMSGIHSFPIYSFGGNGISYTYNYMNPGTAAWVHSGGISMSFTEAGTSPNTYSFTVNSGNGMATIQATTYNSPYTITITRI